MEYKKKNAIERKNNQSDWPPSNFMFDIFDLPPNDFASNLLKEYEKCPSAAALLFKYFFYHMSQ